MAKKDLFGREKDAERRAAIEREAAEEVERLTRRTTPSPGGVLGGSIGGGIGGGPVAPPSDLEMIAESVRERPRGRGATGLGGRAPNPASAFPYGAAMLSGAVGSGLGPAGLSPGPGNRGSGSAIPAGVREAPSSPDYADDEPLGGRFGRAVDEDEEEMSITEIALADYAARSGSSLEDVAVIVDAESAEEMRDRAMRQFHDRQQGVRRPMAVVTDPFAPAAMRSKSATAAAVAQAKLDAPGGRQRPESAGSALAERIAARRRQDEQKRSGGVLGGGGARRAMPSTEVPTPQPVVENEVDEVEPAPLGRLHSRQREETRAAAPEPKSVPVVKPAPAPVSTPSPPSTDPNAHLYEALMEERAARIALEARLEALAAAAAAGRPAKPKRVAKAVASAPVKPKRVAKPAAVAPLKPKRATKPAAGKAPAAKKTRAATKAVPTPTRAAPKRAVVAKPVVAAKKTPASKAAKVVKAPAKKAR